MVQQLVGSSSLGLGKLIDGKNQFIHIRYSAKADGSNMTSEIQPDTKYIGIRTSTSETPSINPADYSWGRFVGTSGTSSYTWIRYSPNEDGSNMTTTANEGTKYIGVAITSENSAPFDHTRYSWALFKGTDGRGVERTDVSYQKSTSGTVIPIGPWSTSIPSLNDGEYLWTRTLFTYTDGKTTSTFSVSRNGIAGLGISRTDVHYQKSRSGTTAPTGTWTVTIPDVRANEYLWTRTTITYTDSSKSISYSVGKMGADGRDAQLLYLTASSQIQAFDKDDNPKTTEAITISAKLQNASGTATFVAIPYIGNIAQTPITLGGTGNDRTLLPSQWTNTKWTIIAITATLGSLTDTISVSKVKDGESGKTPYVHMAWADSEDGTVGFTLELPVGKIPKYRGYYVDYSTEASTNPADYKWERNPDDVGNVADDANDKSDLANQLANAAKELANKANADAAEANRLIGVVNTEVERLDTDVSNAKADLADAEDYLNSKIETVKTTLTEEYATKTNLSETQITLNKTISESVASVKQEMSETYAVKTDFTELSGDYVSFKEDTAKKFSQQVSSIETVQADTAAAQQMVNAAISKAQSAITNATNASSLANSALNQASNATNTANSASQNAANAVASANNALNSANAAKENAIKALADVAALTKTVTTQGTKIDQTSSRIDQVASGITEVGNKVDNLKLIGENLMLNGYGEFGNNKNFNNYIFDGTNSYNNRPSFKTSLKTTLSIGNNRIPIDINKAYEFSMNIKSDNNGKIYLGWYESDIDGKRIQRHNTVAFSKSTTILSKDLNDGDTVVYLESTANWSASDLTYQNGLIFWNYRDSTGYLYPEGVYSRNVWFDLYTKENVNKTNNTITLKSPWNHGTITAGTKVSQSNDGGTYKYRNFMNSAVPTSWTRTGFVIGGDHQLQRPYDYDAARFNPAAKSIVFVAMWSYGTSVVDTYYINSIEFKDIDSKLSIDGINNNLSNNYYQKTTVDSKLSTAVSGITAQYTQDINTKLGNYYDKSTIDSKLTIDGQGITTYVKSTQSQLDNLQVGGRNLLKDTAKFGNSGRPSGSKDGWLNSWHSTVESEKYNGLTVRSLKNATTTKEMCNYYFTGFNLGDTYTLSFWAKGTINTFRCYFYGDSGYVGAKAVNASIPYYGSSSFGDGYCSFVNPQIKNWTRISITWKLDNVGDINIAKKVLIRTDGATGGDLYVCGIKFEKGNTATDWSPAPEDQQAQIDSINSNIANNYYQKTTVDSKLSTAVSGITAQYTQDINTKLGNYYDKSTIDSKLTIDGQGIATYVKSTKSKLDNLQVGGRNLLTKDILGGFRGRVLTNNSDGSITTTFYYQNDSALTNLKAGDTLTFSCKLKKEGDFKGDKVRIGIYHDGTWDSYYMGSLLTKDYKMFSKTITMQKDGAIRLVIQNDNGASVNTEKITFKELKLEIGNKATDWSPAPEDMATLTQYTEVKQLADRISSTVYDSSTGLTTKVNQLAGKYAITALNSAGDILASLNLNANTSTAEINAKLIRLNGETKMDDAFVNKLKANSILANEITAKATTIVNAKITNLDATNIKSGYLDAQRIKAGSITSDKIKVTTLSAITANLGKVTSGYIGNGKSYWDLATGNFFNTNGSNSSVSIGNGKLIVANKTSFDSSSASSSSWDSLELGTNRIALGNSSGFLEIRPNTIGIGGSSGSATILSPGGLRFGYDFNATVSWFQSTNRVKDWYDSTGYRLQSGRIDLTGGSINTLGNAVQITANTGPVNLQGASVNIRNKSNSAYVTCYAANFSSQSAYSAKTDFENIDNITMLQAILKTDIVKYRFKNNNQKYVGFIINDNGRSPYMIDSLLVNDDNSSFSSNTAIGVAYGAIKELNRKLEKLEAENSLLQAKLEEIT